MPEEGEDSPLLTPNDDKPLLTPDAKPLLTPDDQKEALLTPPQQNGHLPSASPQKDVTPEEQGSTAVKRAAPDEGRVDAGSFGTAASAAAKYRKIKKVGVGAYGNVFMAEDTTTKAIVAVKVLSRKDDPVLEGFPLTLLREIGIMRMMTHPNIVQLNEVVWAPNGDPLVIMEYCQSSVLELMQSKKHGLSFAEVKYVIRQIIDAVAHMHKKGILHRDLATKNILFNTSGEIKVCDFGISRKAFGLDEQLGFLPARNLEPPNQIVSLPYRAVELLLGDTNYGPAIDIWGIGSILAEILICQGGLKQTFFGGPSGARNTTPCMTVAEIFRKLGRPTDETWPTLSRLPLLRQYEREDSTLSSIRKQAAGPKGSAEKFAMRKYFFEDEGKCVKSKFIITESCTDLIGGLLTLCPAHRLSAFEALQHPFFKEKPVPEWHAWHWALNECEIARGDDARREAAVKDEDEEMLQALTRQDSKKMVQVETKDGKPAEKTEMQLRLERREAEGRRKAKLEAEQKERAKQRLSGASATASRQSSQSSDGSLPSGWTKHWSASKKQYYYHHAPTKKNQWVKPTA
eukprot:gnl/MRDRNA2_/MRDRNA2_119379_c0_seq1.p1 gnl/MRDRNA2_/MRDRNA2_119379_c0~~gnl/MRDRNA2_/MRDRNA2_119379_c0_seq1.p1  ORF type:complete len:572 (-),score=129.77 gnl/MRDRNA2_/MRDRNA2_119379_c0_seq1:10-1725(-)